MVPRSEKIMEKLTGPGTREGHWGCAAAGSCGSGLHARHRNELWDDENTLKRELNFLAGKAGVR